MEYRQLNKEEISALREEMKAAGEWAKAILEGKKSGGSGYQFANPALAKQKSKI
ncbi:MAG: hypothetical protein ACRDC6_07440 [Shewanella sp.]